MNARNINVHWFQGSGRLIVTLAALLFVTALAACSDATPAAGPTTVAPTPSATTVASPTTPAETTPTAAATTHTPTVAAPPAKEPAPTAEPTTAPTPTATPMPPSPTAEPTVTPAENAELLGASERVYGLVEELLEELGHREAATDEELHAAEHLKERLEAMGYSAGIQSFSFEHFDIERYVQSLQTQDATAKVVVESPMETQSPGLLLSTTPRGGMDSGSLVTVGLGRSEDLPEDGLEGKIVLIEPGDIKLNDQQSLQVLQDKVNAAGAAGAVAAVISGNVSGMHQYRPLMGAESAIPALILLQKEIGDQLHEVSHSSEVTLSVRIETQELHSQNVIAELKGDGDGLVIVGGHYDVVPETEAGANDNTSGISIVLALADALAERSLPFSVRFILFGAEEIGLYGSNHYVSSLDETELAQIVAMLNFDVVASGPWLAVTGQDELTELAMAEAEMLGIEVQEGMLPPGATSDHQPFDSAGVPVLVFYGPDVSRIHTPDDRLEFVQPELLGGAFLVVEALFESPEFVE